MIPKIIHYCWFGGKPIPEAYRQYMESWRKFFPDYNIKEWNETNFDVHCCKYVEQAYEAKKWAFVSDYARFYALYKEGGIYFDTDIEVIKSFDDLIDCSSFFGFSSPNNLTLPVFGSDCNQNCIKYILDYYNTRNFVNEDGSYDTTTIEITAKKILVEKYNLQMNGSYQELSEGIKIYPKEFLYSTDWRTGVIEMTPQLHIIHYAEASWLSDNARKSAIRRRMLIKRYGVNVGSILDDGVTYYQEYGVINFLKKIVGKIFSKR